MSALLAVVSILAGLVLPGYCLSRRLVPGSDLMERWIYAAALGMSTVPPLAFLAAWAFGLHLSRPLLCLVAFALILASIPWKPTRGARRGADWLALALLVACAVLLLQVSYIQDRGERFFDTCLHLSSLFLQQVDGSGWTLYHPKLGAHLTHVLSHDTSPVLAQGLLIDDQRPANGAFLGVFLIFGGRAGIEICAIFVYFVVAGAAALVSRAFLRHPLAQAAVGVATLACLHGLVGYMVNESAFAAAAGFALLALLLREERDAGVVVAAGLLFGFAVGSRLGALLWVAPAALLLLGAKPRLVLAGAASAALCSLPWLLVPWLVAGNPLFHPMGSWAESSILGLSFQFWPLNWPFHEQLVRTPGFILPPLLLLPLLCTKSAGSVAASAAVIGFAFMRHRERPFLLKAVFLAWSLPISLFLLVLAYIDHEKASWLLLGAPVLPLALAACGAELSNKRRRLWVLLGLVALSIPLTFVPRWLAGVELPEDRRRYEVVGGVTVGGGLNLVRGGASSRERMAAAAVLPSLQRFSRHPSHLGAALANVGGGRPFQSGSTHAWIVDREWSSKDLSFPLDTSEREPELSEVSGSPCGPEMGDDLRFWVHLRVPAADRVGLLVSKHEGRHKITLDPGPGPHEPRYVTFLARDHFDPPAATRGPTVEVAGKPLVVRSYGYVCRVDGTDEVFHDLRAVTNLPLKHMPAETRGILKDQGPPLSFEWVDLSKQPRRLPHTQGPRLPR